MKKNIQFITAYMVIFMIYCINFIQFFTVFNNLLLSSTFFMLSFILTCILIFFTYIIYIKKHHKLLIFSSLLLIAATISVLVSCNNFSFEYFKKFIFLMQTIFLLTIAFKNNFPKKEKVYKHFEISIFIQLLIFIIAFYLKIENLYLNNHLLAFNYSNPNFLGLHILMLIISSVNIFSKKYSQKKYVLSFVYMILIVFNIIFIYKSGCRSALLALVIYFAFIFLKKLIFKVKYKYLAITITLIPILVICLYYLINNTSLKCLFSGMIEEGKPLDSRIGVWNEGLEIILKYPLFGNYSYVLYQASFSQLHNIYIDLFASYGIITGTITLITLYYFIRFICYMSYKNKNIKVIGFLVAILFYSSFEATLFTGNNGLNILFFSYLLLR